MPSVRPRFLQPSSGGGGPGPGPGPCDVTAISPLLAFDVTFLLSSPKGLLIEGSGGPVIPRDFRIEGSIDVAPRPPVGFCVGEVDTAPSMPSGFSCEDLDFVKVPRGFTLERI